MDGLSRPLTRAQMAMSPGWWMPETLASRLRSPPHATSALCRRSCTTRSPELTGGGIDTMPQNYRKHSTVRHDWQEAQHAILVTPGDPQPPPHRPLKTLKPSNKPTVSRHSTPAGSLNVELVSPDVRLETAES